MGIIHMGLNEKLTVTGSHRVILRHIRTSEIRSIEFHNLIVSGGRNMIAKQLAGDGAGCNITYGAVGTGTTPSNLNNTTLESELYRKPVTRRSWAGNQALYTVYFGPNEANGELREYALFGEAADGTPDSGTMFNRAMITVTKTNSYTMTFESTITIS